MKQNLESATKPGCEHCGRSFARESTLFRHLCEQKRRWMDSDKPANRIAYGAWNEFYDSFQPHRERRDYRTFIRSPYYSAFVKFGGYCVDIKAVAVEGYIKYLIRNQTPIDDWSSDRIYGRFLIDYLKMEDPLDAVRRTVNNIGSECESENIDLRDFFRYISTNKICHMIMTGKISPWLLYHSKTGIEFLEKLNDAQRSLIFAYIDPEKWMIKFRRNPNETTEIGSIMNQVGL